MTERAAWSRRPYITATILLLIGLYLLIGGVWLIGLGGSWYYGITSLFVLGSSYLLFRGDGRAVPLYWIMLAYTVLWAFYESGTNGWALTARIAGPLVLGLWLLTPWVRHTLNGPRLEDSLPAISLPVRRKTAAVSAAALGALILCVGVLKSDVHAAPVSAAVPPAPSMQSAPIGEWRNYGNTLGGSRYAPLLQLTTANVSRLRPAWTFRTGDLPRAGEHAPREFTFEATPLMANNTLYLCTPHNIVIALDPETGREKWRFNTQTDPRQAFVIACRGVSYYEGGGSGPCAKRIIGGTVDARLYEIDADSGRPCEGFGNGGFVNLLEGMGQVIPGFSYQTSPPAVVNGKIILGGWIIDNMSTNEPSGVVRAFDVQSGRLAWAWDMGAPDRIGAPPPGQTYTRDTPNAWAPFAADPALNLVYIPTGNSPPDWYGAHRRPFDERYSSSVVALDLDTGRPRWSFQTTHHDLWDYDIPSQPVLVDLPINGATIPAVVQSTKRGEIFVLDRRDGRPIYPVREWPAPQGAAPGDRLSPTQPFSAISLLPRRLRESDMWGATPLDQLSCRIAFRQSRYEGIFTPWTLNKPIIVYPGALGVVDWGGIAIDQDRKILVANSSAVPYRDELLPRARAPAAAQGIHLQTPPPGGVQADYSWSPMMGTPYSAHITPFMGPLDIPCTQPPWGFMNAIDLTTGRMLWRTPIGTAQDNGPKGIPFMLPLRMGVPNIGGSIVTGGGLIFNGSTLDRYLRAYDLRTGKELWRSRLPAGGQATPMTYISPASGRQFVVICAGGHQGLQTAVGDYVLAFALPRT